MSNVSHPYRARGFFIAWLAAIALCIVLFVAARAYLSTNSIPVPLIIAPKALPAPALVSPGPVRPLRPFEPKNDSYLITAFSPQGMVQVTDAEPLFTLLPPGNTLVAQVIRRNMSPVPLAPGSSEAHASVSFFLDYTPAAETAKQSMAGTLGGSADAPWFVNDRIDLLPYFSPTSDSPTIGVNPAPIFYPYPTARVTAANSDGATLTETRVVLPVSTEIGCRNCHTGPWKHPAGAGISATTAEQILTVHDRRSHTRLAEEALEKGPIDCRTCHSGNSASLNLSAALHGFHAGMRLDGAEGCATCHPSGENGATRFNRDLHAAYGLDCTRCHGTLTEHAISLLRFEAERGVVAAQSRLALLATRSEVPADSIRPRCPWVNLPQCLGCHNFIEKPDPLTASAFNKWTENKNDRFSYTVDNTGKLRCPSCHGSPHALYPAFGPAGDADNAQPLQYQKAAMPLGKDGNCSICHTVDMDFFAHHDLVK